MSVFLVDLKVAKHPLNMMLKAGGSMKCLNHPPLVPEPPHPNSSKPRTSETRKEEHIDDALLTDGLLFLNFLDATSEGDEARILTQYKHMLLYCKADNQHSTKYALECLYQFFLVFALLSPRDSERFTWNRTINNVGRLGKNVALDLDVEHSYNYIEQAVKNLGRNLTEKAVARICHAEYGARNIVKWMDQSLDQISGSEKHACSSIECDLNELLKRTVQVNAFEEDKSRKYTHSNFESDPFKNLNSSNVYKWINMHKRNIHVGIRAR